LLATACTPEPPPRHDGAGSPVRLDPPGSRLPILLLPGVNREVARVLRGGTLAPFSTLTLRTDRQALAAISDPRFPGDGSAASRLPERLDRELRGTAVRGLQPLVDRLIGGDGYARGNPDRPLDKDYPENPPSVRTDRSRPASLFVLYYDWRRDLAANACVLADRIGKIRASTGSDRVLLVGHSLGGVLARYYLRYGGRDAVSGGVCPLQADPGGGAGESRTAGVARAVFVGAPHRGSAQAFRALLEDFSLFGVVSLGLRDAAVTMPVSWSLLPFAESDGTVPILVGPQGEERVPLFSLRTWTERGWLDIGPGEAERLPFVEAMLNRAVALQGRMAGRHPEEERVRRLTVGSDCRPTLARAIVEENAALSFVGWGRSVHPLFDRATVPGDGVVGAESALGLPDSPTLTTLAVCSRHNGYLEEPQVLERVRAFLLE